MADWLGQYLSTFPLWLSILVIIFVCLVWAWIATAHLQKDKYEWPEDKKKRLAKEKAKAALKAKKG